MPTHSNQELGSIPSPATDQNLSDLTLLAPPGLETQVQELTSQVAALRRSLRAEQVERERIEESLRVTEERAQILAWATHDSIRDWDLLNDQMSWSEGV